MKLEVNAPFETASPTVDIDPGLAPGQYVYSLVVVDAAGNRSQPTKATVTVFRFIIPNPNQPGGGFPIQ